MNKYWVFSEFRTEPFNDSKEQFKKVTKELYLALNETEIEEASVGSSPVCCGDYAEFTFSGVVEASGPLALLEAFKLGMKYFDLARAKIGHEYGEWWETKIVRLKDY